SDIFSSYRCSIHIFEPVSEFATKIGARFAKNPMIHINPFGLAGSDRTERISLSRESSSIFTARPAEMESIRLASAAEYINANGIKRVHMFKINIGGGESKIL